jgi:hypothetical protein
MKLNRKIQIVEQALRSLTTHDDADVAVRHAALERIEAFIKAERAAMDARVKAKIVDAVGEAVSDQG